LHAELVLGDRLRNLVGERVANLESAEDVDHGASHSPETEPNEAIYRGTNHKSEREQPRINVTAARHRAHEPIESRKIVRLGPTRR
jgi:hypothetical protein